MIAETLHPRGYADAARIGRLFRAGVVTVLDLTAAPADDARRLVDFAAGLICGRGGELERLTAKVFLLVPAGAPRPDTAARTG